MVYGIDIRNTSLNEFSDGKNRKLKITKPNGEQAEMSFESYRKFLADEVEKRGGIKSKETFDKIVKDHGIKDTNELLELRKHWEEIYYPEKGSDLN